MKRLYTMLFLWVSLCPLGIAQYTLDGFSISDTSSQWFDNHIGLSGNEMIIGVYQDFGKTAENTRVFYGTGMWSEGSIEYRNERFDQMVLIYDLLKDEVLFRNQENAAYAQQTILLNQSQVGWFKLQGHLFVPYRTDQAGLAAGYYDQIYKSHVFEFLSNRRKVKEVKNGEINYKVADHFIIGMNGTYNRVKSRASVLKLMKPHKKALKAYMKQKNIRQMSKTPYPALQALGKFCHELITGQ